MPIARALLSVSDKHGLAEFARALHAHGIELLSTGGTAQAAAQRGPAGPRSRRLHRFPRDHGRPRQDAASAHARRPARPPRHRRGGHARARHRAHRSAGRQPLSVRRDHRAARLQLRRGDREHRHRRARRCCAPRPRTTRTSRCWSIRPTTRRCSPSSTAAATPRSTRARGSPPRPSRTRPSTTPCVSGYLQRAQQLPSERFPERSPLVLRQGAGPALRRESAPARRVLPRGRARRRLDRRARTCCRARSCRTTTSPDADAAIECVRQFAEPRLRDRQARQSLRRRARRRRPSRPTSAPTGPIRPRPSAASSPSTARSMPPRRERSSSGSSPK